MRRVRLAVVLPLILVALTAVFLIWRDQTLPIFYDSNRPHSMHELYSAGIADLGNSVLRVVNAPAAVFRGFPYLISDDAAWFQLTNHLNLEGVFYLIGVATMWFLVGRTVDQRRSTKATPPPPHSTRQIVFNFALLAYGMFLFFAAFIGIRHLPDWVNIHTFYSSWDFRVEAVAILWAVPLIACAGRNLIRRMRGIHRNPEIV